MSGVTLILSQNKNTNQTVINLHGIAIGNAWIDDATFNQGKLDYLWTHALVSDETHVGINRYCDYSAEIASKKCIQYLRQVFHEVGEIDIYNIYAPLCDNNTHELESSGSVKNFDPCSSDYVFSYLNRAEVQEALHARNTSWEHCSGFDWTDSPITILPTTNQLIAIGISVWIYSGDIDGMIPVTSTRLEDMW
ncbi:hypothetical protein L2E82_17460 [Cichorium intybus]|uniref:Uncharacterized protein n=1 Tax=Cichorium intybus TaxID=13427 RepID=A0ACB9F8V0_CICIN|nr:hypothetical protein L2E82_17460 [Cichorium intybus]